MLTATEILYNARNGIRTSTGPLTMPKRSKAKRSRDYQLHGIKPSAEEDTSITIISPYRYK